MRLIILSVVLDAALTLYCTAGGACPPLLVSAMAGFVTIAFLGAVLIASEQPRAGAILSIIGAAGFLPLGLVGIVGARRVVRRLEQLALPSYRPDSGGPRRSI